jgi:hypothetical protein
VAMGTDGSKWGGGQADGVVTGSEGVVASGE